MQSKGSETWLVGGILYTQDENRSVLKADVQIIDGKIAAIIAPSKNKLKTQSKKARENKSIIDVSGLTIIPGFVQAHVHLCQTLFRNQADDLELLDWLSKRIWVYEAAHTEDTLYTSALLGIYELLSSGTTCILDMGTVRHTDVIFEAVAKTGIRASVGKCLMDHPTQTPASLREKTQFALNEAQALYLRWNHAKNDRIRVSYAPRFAISCTDRLLTAVGKIAQEQGALIHTHASENKKEIELVRQLSGCENIEHLEKLGLCSPQLVLAHCIWLSEKEKKILSKTGTHVVHCPSSNLKLASGIAPVPDLLSRGIHVALGADGAPCNNNLNMFQEMKLAALIHKLGSGPKAMPAMEVLDMATRNGAKALNWFDQIGSIEIGKKADLVALDLTGPLNTVPHHQQLSAEAIASSVVYSSQPAQIAWTMVDGRVLYRNGKTLTISRSSLMQQVQRAQKVILCPS
jgi:5-methylthioadenosine/S-adenosylhomocysteine deaminase